jgi:DNA polymerase I-like protein with 3'-5' exonuclease and polymerase domains
MFFDEEVVVEPKPWMSKKKFVLVKPADLRSCIDHCLKSKKVALDLEGTGLNYDQFDGETVDKIVGVCLSPDGQTGYYIPVRHQNYDQNSDWAVVHAALKEMADAGVVYIFHNAAYDMTMLEYNGLGPITDFTKQASFEDTIILAYLRDTKARRGLKILSKNDLNMEMIELNELFPSDVSDYDFSTLSPENPSVVWYAASDAICTYLLFEKLYDEVIVSPEHSQKVVYAIEKATVHPVIVMEQNRVAVDRERIAELIMAANQELVDALQGLYAVLNTTLSRDVRPAYIKMMLGALNDIPAFRPDQMDTSYDQYLDQAKNMAKARRLDALGKIERAVPVPGKKSETMVKELPMVYDVMSSSQLGDLFIELGVDVAYSEKGNVKTSGEEIDRILDSTDDMASLKAISKMRSVTKALSTYLYPLWNDSVEQKNEYGETIYTVRAGFRQLGTDTGRFAADTSKNPKEEGGTSFTFHGAPSGRAKSDGSKVLPKVRKCVVPRKGERSVILSADYSGVELRIAAALSGEPKWKNEFFRCSTCRHEYERPHQSVTPNWIPSHCVKCGSDRIGDIHTLTGVAIYGEEAANGDPKEWKVLRGNAKCVTGDTIVRVGPSLCRIDELRPANPEPDTFYELNAEVLTEKGFETATLFYEGGVKPVYEVFTAWGSVIRGSDVHPVRVVDGDLTWKSLGELKVGDRIYDPFTPIDWSGYEHSDSAYLSGMLFRTGKGNVLGRYLTQKHAELLTQNGIAAKKHGTKTYSADVSEDADPNTLGEVQYHISFLAGFIEAHGNIRKQERITFSEDSLEMIRLTKMVLSSFGIPTIFREENVQGYLKYVLELPKYAVKYLYPHMRPHSIQMDTKSLPPAFTQPGNYYPLSHEVVYVRGLPPEPVYDLHVPGSHSFWSNGVVSHNSTNFALAYGGHHTAVTRACGVHEAEAKRIKAKFDTEYPVLQQWWAAMKAFGRTHGYVLDAFGRKYPLPDINLPPVNKETGQKNFSFISQAERNAVNSPVQATSATITKAGMVYVHKMIRAKGWENKVRMLMTIHDELVFEVDKDILEEAIDAIVDAMTRNPMVMSLHWDIPLTSDVEFGPDWSVEYNLYAMQKGDKPWPESLLPYFKHTKYRYYTPPSEGNEMKYFHLSDLKKGDSAPAVSTPATPPAAFTPEVATSPQESSEPVEVTAGSFVVVTESTVRVVVPRFDIGFMNDLAYVIERADGTGDKPLRFFTPEGTDITTEFFNAFMRTVMVDADVFKSLVKSRTFQ